MRVARVLTNETCNQGCRFCDARRPAEQPAFVRPAAVAARIDAALAAGAHELVLTGGEPTMRRDLAALVRHAKRRGAARLVLETNATLITDASARELADAGLDLARVHLPAAGARADAITRDPGGSEAALTGLRALIAAAIPLEIAAPIVRDNLGDLPALPARLRAHAIPAQALVAAIPTDAPDASTLAPLADAARALASLDLAARAAAIPLRLDPAAAIPPCALERPQALAHLYALTPGGATSPRHRRIPACRDCAVADRCPGVPAPALAREPEFPFRPIADDRTRRRLTVIESPQSQIDRELVTRDIHRGADGQATPSHIVRIQFHCNQSCTFCFVSTHLPAPDDAAVRRAILEIARAGGVLQLSGGEPTLHPRLAEYVALGKREGARAVELQTNAIRLEGGHLARDLAAAGLDVAFVSLHAATAETSDALTRAPGTYHKTLRGIDALTAAGVLVRLNFVFCAANYREFPDLVRRIAARWPRAELNVSVATAFTDLVPRSAELVPRYTDILPAMTEGLALARAAGLVVHGFESMCGIPLCLAPGDPARHLALAEIADGFDAGEFVRAPACARCDLAPRCFGVRRSYAELHGTDELRPISLAPRRPGLGYPRAMARAIDVLAPGTERLYTPGDSLDWSQPLIFTVEDVLAPGECEEMIARIDALGPTAAPITTHRGFVMRPDIRNNRRVMFDDTDLAAELHRRVHDALPDPLHARRAVGVNERFRCYRYDPGERFAPHFDGAFRRDAREVSELTFMVYLNDAFTGGHTLFHDLGVDVAPRPGLALFFQHRLLHEGCVVTSGTKYALRTDVMYRRPD